MAVRQESVMETFKVVLTFGSVDEILWFNHSNETSLAVLSHGTIYMYVFYKMKFGICLEFQCYALLGVKGLTTTSLAVSSSLHSVSQVEVHMDHRCFITAGIFFKFSSSLYQLCKGCFQQCWAIFCSGWFKHSPTPTHPPLYFPSSDLISVMGAWNKGARGGVVGMCQSWGQYSI